MGRPSLSPPNNVEVPIILLDWKTWFSLWYSSFINVKIEWKSNINRKTKQSIEGQNIKEGGKNGPAQSFPTQQCRSTNNLVGLKTWFSLWYSSFINVKIEWKSNINRKTKRSIEDQKIKEGRKNGPAQSFPTLQLQINVLVWKLDSLLDISQESSDTAKE